MIWTLALIVVIAAVLSPLILRDLERARARHTVQVHIVADVSRFVAAMNEAARALARTRSLGVDTEMRKIREALDAAGIKTGAELRRRLGLDSRD